MAVRKRTVIQIGCGALVLGGILATAIALNSSVGAQVAETPTRFVQSSPTPPSETTPLTQTTPRIAPPIPSPSSAAPSSSARTATSRVKAAGNLVSANQATLAFQIAGRVKEIRVKEGERVKAGTVIAALDNASALDAQALSASAALDKVKAGPSQEDVLIARAALDRAKAALDQAQSAYDRIGGASNPASGASSQALALQQATITYQETLARFNQAVNHPTVAELNAAIAAAETAKQNAAGARLIAPSDGTVLWVGIRVGESATVGTAAAAVADLSRMQVQLNLDEISAASVQVGQAATVMVDALPSRELKGHVSRVALLGTATGNLVTVPVTVDIDATDAPIYPGLSATVEIVSNP